MHRIFNSSQRIVPVLFLFLSPVLAVPASAGVHAGNGEIGFDVGWVVIDGADYGDEGRSTFRGGYHFTDLFQLEGQLIGIGGSGPEGVEALGGIFANAVFNFHPSETIVPYVLVGLGAVEMESFPYYHCHGGHGSSCHHGHDGHHGFHDDYEASGALQLGVGSRFFFGSGRTAVRVEAAMMAFEDDFDRDRELLSLSVGFTWRLGRNRAPKVTVPGDTD